jgi:hypothetical protein
VMARYSSLVEFCMMSWLLFPALQKKKKVIDLLV